MISTQSFQFDHLLLFVSLLHVMYWHILFITVWFLSRQLSNQEHIKSMKYNFLLNYMLLLNILCVCRFWVWFETVNSLHVVWEYQQQHDRHADRVKKKNERNRDIYRERERFLLRINPRDHQQWEFWCQINPK